MFLTNKNCCTALLFMKFKWIYKFNKQKQNCLPFFLFFFNTHIITIIQGSMISNIVTSISFWWMLILTASQIKPYQMILTNPNLLSNNFFLYPINGKSVRKKCRYSSWFLHFVPLGWFYLKPKKNVYFIMNLLFELKLWSRLSNCDLWQKVTFNQFPYWILLNVGAFRILLMDHASSFGIFIMSRDLNSQYSFGLFFDLRTSVSGEKIDCRELNCVFYILKHLFVYFNLFV